MINQITRIACWGFSEYFTSKCYSPVISVKELTLAVVGNLLKNIHVIIIVIDVPFIRQIQVLMYLALIYYCTLFINLVPTYRLLSIKLYSKED